MTGMADRTREVDPEAGRAEYWCRRDAAFDAAREFIRHRHEGDGSVVSISEVLSHLDEHLGGAAGLTGDLHAVLGLCVDLWADPDIDQVAEGWIEFCWNGESLERLDSEVIEALRAHLELQTDTGSLP